MVEVNRVLLDVRGLLVLVDELDLAAEADQRAGRVAHRLQDARRERIRDVHRWRELALADDDLAVVGRANRLVVPRRPVDAVAGAQHVLRIKRVHEANARRDLRARRVALVGVGAAHAGVHQTAANRLSGQRIDDIAQRAAGVDLAIEGDGEGVVLLHQAGLVLDTKTNVDRRLRADTPVVLRVATRVIHEHVERPRDLEAALVARVARRIPKQQRGKGVP